ncbi:MAG: glutamate-1-semialdehyde 2,1-aminomutase, partial [Rhodomicrobiaceae bacterium]
QTTGGAATYALAGAIAIILAYKNGPVIEHLDHADDRLPTGIGQVVPRRGLQAQVPPMGRSCCLLYGSRDADGNPSPALRTLFRQKTIRRGVIMPSLAVSYSHTDVDIDKTIEASTALARSMRAR